MGATVFVHVGVYDTTTKKRKMEKRKNTSTAE